MSTNEKLNVISVALLAANARLMELRRQLQQQRLAAQQRPVAAEVFGCTPKNAVDINGRLQGVQP